LVDSQVVERKLAAIVSIDVAGYSHLMGLDEVGTLRRLQACRAIVDPLIALHHGRIFNTAGDSVSADFASAVDAVECSVAIQDAIAGNNAERPDSERMEMRIGVHLGDVIVEGGDLFGDGVNIASRLGGLAAPGGICVSAAVRDQIGGKLPVAFTDLGDQRVKNITRPVRAYAIGAAAAAAAARRVAWRWALAAAAVLLIAADAAGWWLWPASLSQLTAALFGQTATNSAPRLSIAVLPFSNISDDKQQEYFVDGITEDLTTDLSRIEGMLVIARNTAFTFKGKAIDAKQIGRELNVRYVLEGSVQRSSKEVRINAQLVDTATGEHLWAERFDRDAGDLFALQNEITARIARALQSQLAIAEAARPNAKPDALDYILRGRAALAQPISRDAEEQAVRMFEQALANDPQSADAQSWLAAVLVFRVVDEFSTSPTVDLQRAQELVGHALAAAPNSALAHYVKGQVLLAQSRCAEAIPEYETAIALDRSRAPAYARLGWCKFLTGSVDDAIPYYEQAIRISPHEPSIAPWYGRIGVIELLRSHTDAAIGWLEKARSANPRLPFVHAYLAAAYALAGADERAHAALSEAQTLSDTYRSLERAERTSWYESPKIHALAEATYFAGLRKAGIPER